MRTTWINLGSNDEPLAGNESLPHYKEVRAALAGMNDRPEPYVVRVAPLEKLGGANWEYQFRTSSKEIQLGFGRMDAELLWNFAEMVHEALEKGQGVDQLVLKTDGRLVFVTRVAGTPAEIVAFNFTSNR